MIRGKIKGKIKYVPDEVCLECSQLYEGACRAFNIPHSEKERKARTTEYGMECDEPRLKEIRTKRFGLKYKTF